MSSTKYHNISAKAQTAIINASRMSDAVQERAINRH